MRVFSKLTLILLIFTFISLTASQPCQHPLSFLQLFDLALKNNPQTKSVWWNAQRLAAAKSASNSAYYPDVSFYGKVAHGYDYKYFNSNETIYTDLEAGFSLSYMLLDFGVRNAECKASIAALQAASWQYKWEIQKVIFDVLNLTYHYYNVQEVLEARVASLEDLKTTDDSVEELYRNGLRSITDLYAIKAMTAEAEMELIVQRSEVAIALGHLNTCLGLPFDCQFSIAPLDEPSIDQCSYGNINALVRQAEINRADLQAKYARLQEKEALLKKEKANYLPKLSFDGNAGVQHYLRARDKPKGVDYNVALNFNAPLYIGGESTARKRMAMADVQTANFEIDQQRLTIANEISVYNKRFETSQELFLIVKRYVENAEQSFEGALERYKAGAISIFDLTVAQKLLTQARIRRAEAKSSWYQDLAVLTFSLGIIANEN